jgi:hypothetical protein
VWKPYPEDLLYEIRALTGRRAALVDALAWALIYAGLVAAGLFAG